MLLAKSRWQLRRAIAALHAVLRPLHLRLHRVKRFIGRTSTGFDVLGYRLHPGRKLRPSRRVCAASACVLVGLLSEKATLSPFDGTCSGGGAGSTEACGVGCAELEVLSASHDISWPICIFPGLCAVTVEPPPGASRRDGETQEDVERVRRSLAAEAVNGDVREGCLATHTHIWEVDKNPIFAIRNQFLCGEPSLTVR